MLKKALLSLKNISNRSFRKQLLGEQCPYFFSKQVGLPSFQNYKFLKEILTFVEKEQILTPSPVQQMSFTHFLSKPDENKKPVFIGGPTGSGKTLAYLLPIFQKLKQFEKENNEYGVLPNRPSVIILVPSKELINQICGVAKSISHFAKLKIEKVDTASNWRRSKINMNEGLDVLVTNSNKLIRLLKEGRITLSNLKYLVFDEADVFLESGEEEQMVKLIKSVFLNKNIEEKAQLMFVSATLTPTLKIFLETVFDNNIKFLLTKDTHFNLANLHHDFIPVHNRSKMELLTSELEKYQKVKNEFYFIVFCNSMSCVRAVTYYLKDNGFNCSSLHSDMPLRMRAETYENFKNKKTNVLVCSDLAARGLDFTHLKGVVNFDFPKNANDYLHRAGRAGRIGKKGNIISFYNNVDLPLIDRLKQSNEEGTPLELTQSSFSLKKNKSNEDSNRENKQRNIQSSKLNLPSNFIKFKEENGFQVHGDSHKKKRTLGLKTKPDFVRRKIVGIKNSIKIQEKIRPDCKRAKFLRREIKNIHKAELVRKGKLPIRKELIKRLNKKKHK